MYQYQNMSIIHSDAYPAELFAKLLECYKKQTICLYYERLNSGTGRSQSLGILPRRCYGVGESRNNEKYKDILTYARELAKVICPEINYTTIMLNHNYQALPHKDKNNDGRSCVVAFGDYTGGELEVDGKLYDLRHRPFKFEACNTLHSVKPITSGDRYSIVFFRPHFPKALVAKHGYGLSYDQMLALIPPRTEGQNRSQVKIPY
jgi:hypothetical protein